MVCVLGVRIHTPRLQGEGIPRPRVLLVRTWVRPSPSSMGLPLSGSSLFQVLPLLTIPFEQGESIPALGGF